MSQTFSPVIVVRVEPRGGGCGRDIVREGGVREGGFVWEERRREERECGGRGEVGKLVRGRNLVTKLI